MRKKASSIPKTRKPKDVRNPKCPTPFRDICLLWVSKGKRVKWNSFAHIIIKDKKGKKKVLKRWWAPDDKNCGNCQLYEEARDKLNFAGPILRPSLQGIISHKGKEYGTADLKLDKLIEENFIKFQITNSYLSKDKNGRPIIDEKIIEFEKEVENIKFPVGFWKIAKWSIDKYENQKERIEQRKQERKQFDSLKERSNELEKLGTLIRKDVEYGLIEPIKDVKAKPYSIIYDPDDRSRVQEPITGLFIEMMDRLIDSGRSKHKASNLTSAFIRLYFPKEYPHSPESIRTAYLNHLRPKK